MGRLTDQAGTLETSGVRGGPHATLAGVAPVFDIADEDNGVTEKREVTLEERFTEKAVAGNGDTAEPTPPYDPAGHQAGRITDQTDDTSGTVSGASVQGHETTQALQTDTWETDGTGGQPSPEIDGITDLEDGTSLKGEGSFTAAASQGEGEGESTEPDADPEEGLDDLVMADLYKLAKAKDVTLPSGALKAEVVATLEAAGLTKADFEALED